MEKLLEHVREMKNEVFWLRTQELIRERFQEGKIYGNCSILELDVHVTGVHFTTILNNLTDVTYIALCFKYHMINANASTKSRKQKINDRTIKEGLKWEG